jgi:nucleotide-binding universal stress UspA family protein
VNPTRKKQKQPIVCGTDFSATAQEAVTVAAGMAARAGTNLLLLHVEEFHGMAEVDPSLFEGALLEKQRMLEREAKRARDAGAEVKTKLVSGSVFDELVTAATDARASAVIVGAVGHGLARRIMVGSVAERTAETSPVPTLVVRPRNRLTSWLRGEHPLKILVGYDCSAAGDTALGWIKDLRAIAPCEISIFHIDWPPGEAQRLGFHGPLPLTENPQPIQNFLERDVSERVALQLPPEEVMVTIEPGWGRPEAQLFAAAERLKADLIVVGTHQRHGFGWLRFGSVSRAVLRHAPTSVAVVPPPESKFPKKIPVFDRVLVASDFSDIGNRAVPYACAILQAGGNLKLLHVIPPPGTVKKGEPRPGKENPKLRSQLLALVPAEARARLEVETEVVEHGDAAEAIAQAAERFDADVVCLGSYGRTGLTKTILGSVAQEVVQKSRRPVLLMRGEQE